MLLMEGPIDYNEDAFRAMTYRVSLSDPTGPTDRRHLVVPPVQSTTAIALVYLKSSWSGVSSWISSGSPLFLELENTDAFFQNYHDR